MLNINEQQIHRYSHNELIKELTKRKLSTNGNIHILRTRLIKNYENNTQQSIQQAFDFLAVIDFEATCVAKPSHPYLQEIIEFPIILIDINQKTIIDIFHSYCRPILQPILSNYCKQLTGIKQEQVNNAPTFIDVFSNVEKWLNNRDLLTNLNRKCIFVTDSPSDFNKYLHMQCEISHITYPTWAHQWINIKNTFTSFYSINSGRIHNMLQKLGLSFHGDLHSGLDDARNIGTIAIELIKDGCILIPNEFYQPLITIPRQNPNLSIFKKKSSGIMYLNCSRSHSETRQSCVRRTLRHKQKSRSSHSRFHSNK